MPAEYFLPNTQSSSLTPGATSDSVAGLIDGATGVSCPGLLVPTPQPTVQELTDQVNALRAQLRDARLADSKQRGQIKNQAVSIRELTSSLQSVIYDREQCEIDLKNERKAHRAAEKKVTLIASNHASAINRLASQSVEVKALCNERDYLTNDCLRTKEQLQSARNHLKKTKQELEDTGSTLVSFKHREQCLTEELAQVKFELRARDRKVKFLEDALDRQHKNNALLKADYREIDFTRVPNVPITVCPPQSPLSKSSPSGMDRTPLANLETNKVPTARKRTRDVCDDENSEKRKASLSYYY